MDPPLKKGTFTMENSSVEMKELSLVMAQVFKVAEALIAKGFGGKADYEDPAFKMMVMTGADAPLRAMVLSSGGAFPGKVAEGLLTIANGHPLKGIKKMIQRRL